MKQIKKFTLSGLIAVGVIVCYFITGLFITPDYGVNWDDPVQRERIGISNWDFITHTNSGNLVNGADKYHGPAFEILLIAVEKTLHLTDMHDIMLSRHYAVFVFSVSVLIVFFLFCRRLFDSSLLGLLGMALLLLTPRIFAESFYNPKDIVFMGAMVWAMYSMLVFSESPTFLNAILHAFTCAFTIDVRVIGILVVPITFILLGANLYRVKIRLRNIWTKTILYIFASFVFIVGLWPILMTGPLGHLWLAFKQLSNYVIWTGHTLYLGNRYPGIDTPWHYHWVWLLVTLPEIYILLFLAGIFIFLAKILLLKPVGQTKTAFILISFFFFFFPLIYRGISHSVVYDGWRHVYFTYPFFLVVTVYAAGEILSLRKNLLRSCLIGIIVIAMSDSLVSIILMHPFEYVYFNHTANSLLRPIDQKLEMDYWGVSYKQGLEYVMAQTKDSAKVRIAFANDPGYYNFQFLKPELRARFEPVDDRDSAQYFLTNYRDLHTPSPPGMPYHTIRAQGNVILGIYKLK
jgi:hypothetical protein